MARNTRSRRGEAATEMQEDPEAIMRSARQRVRADRRQRPQVQAAEQGAPGPPAAAAAQGQSAPQNAEADLQAGDASEDNRLQDGTSASPAGDTNRPDESGALPTLATSGQQTSSGANEQDGGSNEHRDEDRSASSPDSLKETSADAGTTSPTQQEENSGGSAETDNPTQDGNEQAKGEKHDLDDRNEEESEPKRPRQESDGAGPLAGNVDGQEQPPPNPCQDFRNALRTFQALADQAEGLHEELAFAHGQYLPEEALHSAIASVTEAISERGLVLFSLLDRMQHYQRAARRGQNFMWVQHRRRDGPGATSGGHFSLFIGERNREAQRFHVEHRDSYPQMRNGQSVRDAWTAARRSLGPTVLQWQIDEDINLPEEITVPTGQFDQTDAWTCGLYTILNAWIHALGLSRSQGRPLMTRPFTLAACDLVRCAMQGYMDSRTIRNFLECYNFIEAGAQIDASRTFDRTVEIRSQDAFAQRLARVRLNEDLEETGNGAAVPSIDDMVRQIAAAGGNTNLTTYGSIQELYNTYTHVRDAFGGHGGMDSNADAIATQDDDDEALARRIQNEEYQRELSPQGQAAGQESSGPHMQHQQPDLARHRDAQDGNAQSGPHRQSNAHPQRNASDPEGGNIPSQQTDAQVQRSVAGQGEARDGQRREGEDASVAAGVQNAANRDERENAPSSDEEMRRSQGPARRPSGDELGVDAATRRQRALERLRPANDPFRPGRPLRQATVEVQRGLDQGESELAMIVAPYSDLPRHQTLRNQYGLPNLTNAFHRPEQNEPPAQQQRNQPNPPPPAAAAPGEQSAQQDEQPPSPNTPQQPPASGAPQQPPAGGADAARGEQQNADSAASQPPAGSPSGPGPNTQPPPPAAGQPLIPGLQSTIPRPSPEAGPAATAPTNPAPAANNADDQPSSGRTASQESLPDYEVLMAQEKEEEERQQREQREELERRGREFEQETQQARQRTREQQQQEEGGGGGEGEAADGDDGMDSLFGEAGSSTRSTEQGD